MKKTLRESLVDHDMALLRGLAEARGAVLSSNHRLTAAEELAAQLLTPASLAIALADLSPAETEALETLQSAGGWMEAPRFARRFGSIRSLGPGRLERERPWREPASTAEGLWYRAFIFKGFRRTEGGVVEVAYIPADLLAALPAPPPQKASPPTGGETSALEPAAPPPYLCPANTDVVEDVFAVLVTLRNRGLRLKPDGSPDPKDLQAINALCVSPLEAASVAGDERLAFVVHLPLAANLVTLHAGRPALNADPARAWLSAPSGQRLLALQRAWRDDPGWNDLWHVPSLKPQPTGWRNDPLLARRQILGILGGCHPGDWYGLERLVGAVKESAPDFQRPDGDYNTWYIHNLDDQPLMGFEHWDQVEGALLRHLISGPLHWLGVLDLGFEQGSGQPRAFRLADTGLLLLELTSSPTAKSQPSQPSNSPELAMDDDLTVRVSADALYPRFQLARFADFLEREAGQVRYRLSPQSLARARNAGITPEQISSFLARASGARLPASVVEGLRNWGERSGSVRLEPGVVLRVDRPETIEALRREPVIEGLLGETLGPNAVLVPRANVRQVRRWLIEQGYLDN